VTLRALPLVLGLALVTAPAAGLRAGEEGRPVGALSAEAARDLLEGRGMGLAKVAELNSYPGPLHVLELAERLSLTPAQRAAVEDSRMRMSTEAKRLGAELVAEEQALDRAFAAGRITPEEIDRRTGRIGELQGRLRAAHLKAHLETRAILESGQIARYDSLRGYREAMPEGHGPHGKGHGG
jgi:hypothetical protein